MEKVAKIAFFIVAGVAFVAFVAKVFWTESKAFDFDFKAQSNPSYYDGYGELPEYVCYGIFKDLKQCYGDAQAMKLLDDFVAKRVSFSELEAQIKACKTQLKNKE